LIAMAPEQLGRCGFVREKWHWSLTLDALALERYGADTENPYAWQQIRILSAVGPATAVKAVSALVQSKIPVSVYVEVPPQFERRNFTFAMPVNVWRQRLAFDHWQILVMSADADLIPAYSQRGLWQRLNSSAFTTPLLRDWMPWLGKRLLEQGKLKRLSCFRCDAAVLRADTGDIDKAVSYGIRTGALKLE